MSTMQKAILETLTENLPEGIEARQQPQWANTGRVYFQRGFTTLVELAYDFQDSDGSIRLNDVDPEQLSVRGREGYQGGASRPSDGGPWLGWYFKYRDGERIEAMLAAVRDLIKTRAEESTS